MTQTQFTDFQDTKVTGVGQTTLLDTTETGKPMYFPAYLEFTEGAHYRKLKRIAEGAMGEVWYCDILDSEMKERTGVKVCVAKISKKADEQQELMLRQEVAITHHLKEHPNIVKTIGFSFHPPTLLMKHFETGSLADLLYSHRRGILLTPQLKLDILSDVAAGLQFIHAQDITHMDIKPANIMLTQEHGHMRAAIGDFGVAHILSDKAGMVASFNVTNVNALSIRYAAPDLVMAFYCQNLAKLPGGQLKLGDVYSLAIVIYEVLCEQLTWAVEAKENSSKVEEVKDDDRAPPAYEDGAK
jgi:serine/threonine protein kinase